MLNKKIVFIAILWACTSYAPNPASLKLKGYTKVETNYDGYLVESNRDTHVLVIRKTSTQAVVARQVGPITEFFSAQPDPKILFARLMEVRNTFQKSIVAEVYRPNY